MSKLANTFLAWTTVTAPKMNENSQIKSTGIYVLIMFNKSKKIVE